FDELATMAFEHSSLGPALHEITPATISSGLVPNPPPSTPFVPGKGYSLKDKNKAKTDKTEHGNRKSIKSQSQSQAKS
ncbi:hypothetical protein Tco_0935025, partial [Tanacetum coccineum]